MSTAASARQSTNTGAGPQKAQHTRLVERRHQPARLVAVRDETNRFTPSMLKRPADDDAEQTQA